MSDDAQPQQRPGHILWRDLTVPDAPVIRDFYKAVIGWEHSDHPMGDYNDYNMLQADTGEVITGIINQARRECCAAGGLATVRRGRGCGCQHAQMRGARGPRSRFTHKGCGL